jgi:predicted outer membrane repeat protein
VVLAVWANGAFLETLTVAGGIGPEATSYLGVTPPKDDGVTPDPSAAQNIARNQGGGIYNVNSFLRLTNVRIRNNKSFLGGGMYTESRGEKTTSELDNVAFFSNTALKSGGGMYNMASSGICNPIISNSTFDRNKSVDMGGGLYNGSGDFTANITNTVFTSNSAKTGGGIYTAGGTSLFNGVTVSDNWTLENGSGIYNASEALFENLDVTGNVALGGAGVGIYNAGITGIIRMTNAKLENNSGSLGGGMYNAGTAVLANVTIQGNATGRGGGIENSGSLMLANCIIKNNTATAGNGGGLSNYITENSTAHAVLANVSLTGNSGGGIYNYYEGSGGYYAPRNGFINILLQNTLIAGNTGSGIYNYYDFYSGRGINLTLNNTTIADNTGPGVFTKKGGGRADLGVEDDMTPDNQRAFPIYIRFRNSVVYQNGSGGASQWDWAGYSNFTSANTPGNRETYHYSLLEGMDLSASNGNLDGSTVLPGFAGAGDYRPGTGSSLINKASTALYPNLIIPTLLLNELCWKTGGDGGLSSYVTFPVYINGNIEPMSILDFLGYDNSFNVGDLRDNGSQEGPKDKRRRSDGSLGLAIGAYEQ